jgi:hypothetical protein
MTMRIIWPLAPFAAFVEPVEHKESSLGDEDLKPISPNTLPSIHNPGRRKHGPHKARGEAFL